MLILNLGKSVNSIKNQENKTTKTCIKFNTYQMLLL